MDPRLASCKLSLTSKQPIKAKRYDPYPTQTLSYFSWLEHCIIYSNLCHSFIPFVHSKTLSCCTTRTELGLILVFALEVLRISLEIPTDNQLRKV